MNLMFYLENLFVVKSIFYNQKSNYLISIFAQFHPFPSGERDHFLKSRSILASLNLAPV